MTKEDIEKAGASLQAAAAAADSSVATLPTTSVDIPSGIPAASTADQPPSEAVTQRSVSLVEEVKYSESLIM